MGSPTKFSRATAMSSWLCSPGAQAGLGARSFMRSSSALLLPMAPPCSHSRAGSPHSGDEEQGRPAHSGESAEAASSPDITAEFEAFQDDANRQFTGVEDQILGMEEIEGVDRQLAVLGSLMDSTTELYMRRAITDGHNPDYPHPMLLSEVRQMLDVVSTPAFPASLRAAVAQVLLKHAGYARTT